MSSTGAAYPAASPLPRRKFHLFLEKPGCRNLKGKAGHCFPEHNFINEVADLIEEVGADVQKIARGIALDNRIGTKFLNPGELGGNRASER
jgi:UDPglucose 6-dehydrogenase